LWGKFWGNERGKKKKSNMNPTKDFVWGKKRPKVAISQGEKTEITMFRQEVPSCHQNVQCYFTQDNYIKE